MKMDKNKLSTCSISFIKYEPEKAFEIIAHAGFKKVDILERLPHFSLFADECDPKKFLQAAKIAESKLQILHLMSVEEPMVELVTNQCRLLI